MTNKIEKIYTEFITTYEDKPDFVINFYTKNSIFLNNILVFNDKEELRHYIEMTWHYLNAILNKDYFNDTIVNSTKTRLLIDSEIVRLNATDLKNEWYYGIMYIYGIAYYRLKDYKTSTQIFKTLSQNDINNDNYKSWLLYSVYGERIKFFNIIGIVCGLLIFTEILFKSYISNYYVRQTLLSIGLLGVLSTWGYDYYIKYNIRKKKAS